MSYGFEVFDENGNKTLSSDSVAYLLVDVIEVAYPNQGSKQYSDLPSNMSLVADWAIIDITLNTQFEHIFLNGGPIITVVGDTVSWAWGAGFNELGSVSIRVFAS